MLSSKEKRFIKYWEEQRKGGRWPFYFMYIPAGTFMATIVLSLVILMMVIGGIDYVPYIGGASFVVITIVTIRTWSNNEKKFKTIIRREITEGQKHDGEGQ